MYLSHFPDTTTLCIFNSLNVLNHYITIDRLSSQMLALKKMFAMNYFTCDDVI